MLNQPRWASYQQCNQWENSVEKTQLVSLGRKLNYFQILKGGTGVVKQDIVKK